MSVFKLKGGVLEPEAEVRTMRLLRGAVGPRPGCGSIRTPPGRSRPPFGWPSSCGTPTSSTSKIPRPGSRAWPRWPPDADPAEHQHGGDGVRARPGRLPAASGSRRARRPPPMGRPDRHPEPGRRLQDAQLGHVAALQQPSRHQLRRDGPRRGCHSQPLHASDTHYPWNTATDIVNETDYFRFENGTIELWETPGLGVSLNEDRLAEAAEAYQRLDATAERDDVSAMRERNPDWLPHMPKW